MCLASSSAKIVQAISQFPSTWVSVDVQAQGFLQQHETLKLEI